MGLKEIASRIIAKLGGEYSEEAEVQKLSKLTNHVDKSADLSDALNKNLTPEQWLEIETRRNNAFKSLRALMGSTQKTPKHKP